MISSPGSDAVASQESEPRALLHRSSRVRRSPAATRWVSILTMQVCLMILRSSSGRLSRPGMRLSLSRPSHTGTAFFQDCRHMAWILVLAIEQGRYISLDAADALSTFMINGMPDPVRFLKVFGDLIATAAEAAKGKQARVAVFGECVHLLWATR